ncbi:hypothetical protein JCM8097_008996 [Rhodosporidiobolus ruineniae]
MASDTLSTSSYLDRLPDELWLEVLANLDYYRDLQTVRRVCKKVDSWVKSSALDANLFRRPPSSTPLKPGSYVELHPAIDGVEGVMFEPGFVTVQCWEYEHQDELNLFDYPAMQDFATQPACTALSCALFESYDGMETAFVVEDPEGVKVCEFLTKLNEYWTGVSSSRWTSDRKVNCKLQSERSWSIDLGDRNGWVGWYRPTVDSDGLVEVQGQGFDS